MNETLIYNPEYRIYKPGYQDDYTKGCASCWEWNYDKDFVMLTIAKQNKDKNSNGMPTYDWKNETEGSSMFLLGIPDLCAIVNVLSNREAYLGLEDSNNKEQGKGLFHKNPKGNAILKLYHYKQGWILNLSTKKGGKLFQARHTVSKGEATYLVVILENVMWKLFQSTGYRKG